jgi:hypothetical protein
VSQLQPRKVVQHTAKAHRHNPGDGTGIIEEQRQEELSGLKRRKKSSSIWHVPDTERFRIVAIASLPQTRRNQ